MADKNELGQALSNFSTEEKRIKIEGLLHAVKAENTDSFVLQIESDDYSMNDIGDMPENWVQFLLDEDTVSETISYLKSHTEMPGEDFEKLEDVTAKSTFNEAQKIVVGDVIFFNIDSGILIEVSGKEASSKSGNKGNENRFSLNLTENQMATLLKALSKFSGDNQ